MKVKKLPSHLADQIAAGEVVERPASVVKELVENALDAGATRVRVDVDNGGLARIRVTDDGEGMEPADAQLALERHATSKIAAIEDLARLGTFGFRGEALPSIASVSRLTLTTRARGADEGVAVAVEGAAAPRVKPAGCAVGTSVEVADLFFNVPARRKFLKAPATESAHVGEVVVLAALARPDVTFQLSRDGKMAREHLRASSRGERVAQVFGDEPLVACRGARGPFALEAYVGAPERARAGATALHVFVNGRPVKDRALARAVAQAYGSVLEGGRFPIGVLYIELPPELVDVNVHPQKAEVRFADARAVLDAVTRELYATTSRAFAIPALGPPSRPWLKPVHAGARATPTPPSVEGPATLVDPSSVTQVSAGDLLSAPPPPVPLHRRPGDEGPRVPMPSEPPLSAASAAATLGDFPTLVSADHYAGTLARPAGPASLSLADGGVAPGSPVPLFAHGRSWAALRFLAQLRATFLLCEGEDGLYVLDQHAAAERVTFDRLRRAYGARSVGSQRLLVPEVVEVGAAAADALEANAAEVSALGLEVRAVGPGSVAVHAVPRLLGRATPERLVRDVASELTRDAARPFAAAADLVLATMACHGSIRAGDRIAPEEATALLAALDAVDFSGHCPHGRPVVTRVPFADLERRVGR